MLPIPPPIIPPLDDNINDDNIKQHIYLSNSHVYFEDDVNAPLIHIICLIHLSMGSNCLI